jgi:hypothetical protein
VVITAVALLGFLVPAESGEKVSVSVTTLLSLTVFLMIVVENMPPNSDELPMIGKFYYASTPYASYCFLNKFRIATDLYDQIVVKILLKKFNSKFYCFKAFFMVQRWLVPNF